MLEIENQHLMAAIISTHSTCNSLDAKEEFSKKRFSTKLETPKLKKSKTQDIACVCSEKKPEKSLIFEDLDEIKERLEQENARIRLQKDKIKNILQKINKK